MVSSMREPRSGRLGPKVPGRYRLAGRSAPGGASSRPDTCVSMRAPCLPTSGSCSCCWPAPFTACGGDSQPDSAPSGSDDEPRLVVVDTDGGSDDAMALLYLLQHPGVEVAAITVTGAGLVHCPVGASNVAGVVDLVAPDRDIPIACGSGSPLEGDRAFPDEWRAQADGRYGGILPAGPEGAPQPDAARMRSSCSAPRSKRPIARSPSSRSAPSRTSRRRSTPIRS